MTLSSKIFMTHYQGFKMRYCMSLYHIILVRDDDSDCCDVQMMADDSQVNSPSVERRSPVHQPLNGVGPGGEPGGEPGDHEGLDKYECMS